MRLCVFTVFALLLLLGCQADQPVGEQYPDQMGYISFDPSKDSSAFQLCDEADLVHSRTSLSYEGGRARIVELSRRAFAEYSSDIDFTGYVMAHFLVNCKGKIGRLRIDAMDDAFIEKEAPEALINLIDKSVRQLDAWIVSRPANEGKDHSKYLNFKIVNGQIDAITH